MQRALPHLHSLQLGNGRGVVALDKLHDRSLKSGLHFVRLAGRVLRGEGGVSATVQGVQQVQLMFNRCN